MGQIFVYDEWPTAVDTNGLCGPLTPTSAKYAAAKNGEMELTIDHPIDEWGKWACLEPGNLIRADIPMRTSPLIAYSAMTYMVNPTRYVVASGASRSARSVMSAAPYNLGGVTATPFRLCVIDVGEPVYVVQTVVSWCNIVWAGGRGWILASALSSSGTTTLSDNRADTEIALPSPRTRMQLFRIYRVSLSDKGVQVNARHVSYDIMGARVTWTNVDPNGDLAMSGLFANANWPSVAEHVWTADFNNLSDQVYTFEGWERIGAIETLLAPSNSISAYWNAAILRDNWTFTCIHDPEYASGYVIEYAKNLRGVTYDTDVTDVQSALIPVGQTYKGKPLIVPTGTYTVDGANISVTDGVVRSANDTYPIPHVGVLDLGAGVKAAGTTSTYLNAAYVKLIRAALKEFADKQCDLPPVTLNVDFIHLGDTAEYAQYRDLQKLFLYDTIRIKHPPLGIDVTTQANRIVWDCLTERYDSIELGSVRKNYARSKLAGWMVPGYDSLKSYVSTIAGLI